MPKHTKETVGLMRALFWEGGYRDDRSDEAAAYAPAAET
jgi:hypothetical protein